jgi:hypothetical protein
MGSEAWRPINSDLGVDIPVLAANYDRTGRPDASDIGYAEKNVYPQPPQQSWESRLFEDDTGGCSTYLKARDLDVRRQWYSFQALRHF